MSKSYGLIIEKRLPEDYCFGSATKIDEKVINSSGQWDDYLPEIEFQKRHGVEPMNCTNHGTNNCEEILEFYIYGSKRNNCERYNAIMSGTTENGNTPNKAAQSVRHDGEIDEELLPFTEDILTFDDYYLPKPMKPEYIKIGAKWAKEWDFGHEWVECYPKLMMTALKRSPLGASVHAWKEKDGICYKDKSDRDNHWVCIYGYVENEYWKIFDTYDCVYKKVVWDYDFSMIKRYSLIKKPVIVKDNWVVDLWKRFVEFLRDIAKIKI